MAKPKKKNDNFWIRCYKCNNYGAEYEVKVEEKLDPVLICESCLNINPNIKRVKDEKAEENKKSWLYVILFVVIFFAVVGTCNSLLGIEWSGSGGNQSWAS